MLEKIKKKSILRFGLFIILILPIILINQLALNKILSGEGSYFCNKGISFGLIIAGWFWLVWFLFLFFLIFFLFQNYTKNKNNFLIPIASALLLGGILFNISDRLNYGCVVDYIPLKMGTNLIFNLSDMEIFIGLSIIIFFLFKNKNKNC